MHVYSDFVLLALAGVSLFCASILYTTLKKGAPWFPTRKKNIRALLRASHIKPGETVMDAGCGDGRVLIVAAKEFGARCIGIETHWFLVLCARLWARLAGVSDRVQIIHADLFSTSFDKADVLFLFLLQKTNVRLQEKIQTELRPGSCVASYAFTLPDLQEMPKNEENPLFHLYTV